MQTNEPTNPRVALVIDVDWPYKHHQGILSGILEYARPRGWRCEFTPFLGLATAAKEDIYDGIIGRATRQLQRYARKHSIPAVNVWVNSPVRNMPNVLPDKVATGELSAAHFISRGYRRFGFLGQLADANSRLLLEGFSKSLQGHRYPLLQRWTKGLVNPADWRKFQELVRRWMEEWSYPIAILCSTDPLARYFADSCIRIGLRIPQDVAIMSIGNTEITCEMCEPRLSSVEHGFERVGVQAAALLDEMMHGRRLSPSTTLIAPAGVVTRTSTDAFAVQDPEVEKALRVIQELSQNPVRVADVLEAVPLSRRTLERRFREVLGCSIHDEITRAYLERAKHLLVSTRDPLKWIATRAGFSSPQRLSRVFREIEKVTPQEYRRSHGKTTRPKAP